MRTLTHTEFDEFFSVIAFVRFAISTIIIQIILVLKTYICMKGKKINDENKQNEIYDKVNMKII